MLPRARHTDSHRVRRGYAVGMAGTLPQMWLFFDHIEPALVCGRAARMSCFDIMGYGVYEGAQEVRFDERLRRDVRTLYVLDGDSLDRHTDEAAAFTRWIAGCDPKSSHFKPETRHRQAPYPDDGRSPADDVRDGLAMPWVVDELGGANDIG
ncbi:hypothetical protein GCM10023334_029120 [Nonomuraea thailandensis]